MLELLKNRIEFLLAQIESSAGQHNSLVGRLAESKELLAKLEADAAAALKSGVEIVHDGKAILDCIEGKEHAA